MSEEKAFLRAIQERPTDAAPRLVYADWLDERDDPRGEYLQLLCAAAGWAKAKTKREQVIARLQELGTGLNRRWLEAVQVGIGWRLLFEANLPPLEQRRYEAEYKFGPPATKKELAAAEQALGFRLPADVRGMVSEFNGVWDRTRAHRANGGDWEMYFLDLREMVSHVGHMREIGWEEHFQEGELGKLVFVCQWNNFADLWAVCAADVAGHKAGTVVFLDHDDGQLEAKYPGLAEFVSRGPKG